MLNWKYCFQNGRESHVFFIECSLSKYDQHPFPRPQLFPPSQRFIAFTLSSNFKAFLASYGCWWFWHDALDTYAIYFI
jgi:hypothetical protein